MNGAQLACPLFCGAAWQTRDIHEEEHCTDTGSVERLPKIGVTSVFGESFYANLLTEFASKCEEGRWRLGLRFGLRRHDGLV